MSLLQPTLLQPRSGTPCPANVHPTRYTVITWSPKVLFAQSRMRLRGQRRHTTDGLGTTEHEVEVRMQMRGRNEHHNSAFVLNKE